MLTRLFWITGQHPPVRSAAAFVDWRQPWKPSCILAPAPNLHFIGHSIKPIKRLAIGNNRFSQSRVGKAAKAIVESSKVSPWLQLPEPRSSSTAQTSSPAPCTTVMIPKKNQGRKKSGKGLSQLIQHTSSSSFILICLVRNAPMQRSTYAPML